MALTKTDYVSEAEYRRLALGNAPGAVELYRGRLRERPGMSVEHGDIMVLLTAMIHNQLDRREFKVRVQHARLRLSSQTYYIPDLAVVPTSLEHTLRVRPGTLDAYPEPLPLVVEIWSPSTGDYDINEKLQDYQQRGDLEIWRVHPYERSLTAWRRQPNGEYAETVYREGIVQPAFLPSVEVDLEELFSP